MTPREIDALLAERLFGWTRVEQHEGTSYAMPFCVGSPPNSPEPCDSLQGTGEGRYHVPRYSTTWNGMGAVIEAMRAKGSSLTRFDDFCQALMEMNDGEPDDGGTTLFNVMGSLSPMAVALAALRALGVEVASAD